MVKVKRFHVLGTAAVALVAAFSGVASAGPPVRGSTEFVFPDLCTFPVRVHFAFSTVETPHALISNAQTTISTLDGARSFVDRQAQRFALDEAGDIVGVTGVRSHVVIPGVGTVFGEMGRLVFLQDGGILVFGRSEGDSSYGAAVCGFLAG